MLFSISLIKKPGFRAKYFAFTPREDASANYKISIVELFWYVSLKFTNYLNHRTMRVDRTLNVGSSVTFFAGGSLLSDLQVPL